MRVLLPQMYDGDHPYAIDVTKVDEAFASISRVVNGGMDESNFSDGLTFANETSPGAVSYSFGAPYSRIALRGQMFGTPNMSPLVLGRLPDGLSLGVTVWVSAFTWATTNDLPTVTFKVGSTTIYEGQMKRIGDVTGKYVMVSKRVRAKDEEGNLIFTDNGKPVWVTETSQVWIADGNKFEIQAEAVLPLAAVAPLEAGGVVTATVAGPIITRPSTFEIAFAAKQVA